VRLLVCGGRSYSDREKLFWTLDALHAATPVTLIIHGGASGADALADAWAKERGIPVQVFEADWSNGRSGGPIRNRAMLNEGKPDQVVAFPGGTGTANMVKQSYERGVLVVNVK
jgi:hypothetical protein